MKENEMNIIEKAIIFATGAHKGTFRKGTNIPYIIHPLEAGAIASGLTNDYEVIAATFLHDTLEDTDTSFEDIEREFGPRVAQLVKSESEDKHPELPAAETWRVRKQATIDDLGKADPDVIVIAFSDKLANLRAIYSDYLKCGNELWERFNQKDPKEHLWYYSSFLSTCSMLSDTAAYKEYASIIKALTERLSFEKAKNKALVDFIRNPHWKEYYEEAPSDVCKEYIKYEFLFSDTDEYEEKVAQVLRELEDRFTVDDWKHLIKYCGNNPFKSRCRAKIKELEAGNQKSGN